MKNFNLFTVAIGISTCILVNGVALGQQKKSADLPLDPAVRHGKLSNGFTYYIRHNEEPKHRVVMYLVNKAGSILEDEDQRGLAHFMEHMSFNGTVNFPKNDLVDYLQKSGIRFGADLNAYTSFDETVYQLPIPSDKPELLTNGIKIMHDWANGATLDPVEIDKERGVVLEEKRLGKGAGERMQRRYLPMLLNNSRYSERIPIGLDTVLSYFKPETIKRFYQDWYRPDLQALVIVGDIDADKMEQIVKAQFSDLKNPVNEKLRTKYSIELTGKNQFIVVTDKENTGTSAQIIIKHKATSLKTTDDYRRLILQSLFNQMLGARYVELSRKPNTSFINLGAHIGGLFGGLDCFSASVVSKPGEIGSAVMELWREVARLKQLGFTQSELNRAKSAYLNATENRYNEKNKVVSDSYVSEYQRHFLQGEASPGLDVETKLVKEFMPGITLQDMKNITDAYLTLTNRDIIIAAPDQDKNNMPDETTVNGWLSGVEAQKQSPYNDEVLTKPLIAHQPVPGKIVKTEENKALGITTLTLSNGLKVILKPTDFSNTDIMFSGFSAGGTSRYPDEDYQSAYMADGLVSNGGIGNYNKNQLNKFLEDKQVFAEPYIIDRLQGINANTNTRDLETSLQMVYCYFTEPRKDTSDFRGMIQRSIAKQATWANSPNNVYRDTMWAVNSNYNVRRTGPSLTKIKQINFERAFAIYKELYADASGFTFTFVGSIDINTIKPLLEKYLGSLPSTYKNLQPRDLDIHPIEGQVTKIIRMGSEPKATIDLEYSGKFDYSAENKVKLDALKEALQIRLIQRLREEESGAYAPFVFASASKDSQPRYILSIRFGCSPQNADKLIASVQDEARKLRTDGPPQENVDKWRAEVKNSRETESRYNSTWLHHINSTLQNKDDLVPLNSDIAIIDKITPADVKEMAQKYLSGDNFIRLELLPETPKS